MARRTETNLFGKGVAVRTRKQGTGERHPRKGDLCVIHYQLYYMTSTEPAPVLVEDTRTRQLPHQFRIGQGLVLPGLEVALQGMTVGQVAEVFVPAWYAYGSTGSPPWIPPAADLLFHVTVLQILPVDK